MRKIVLNLFLIFFGMAPALNAGIVIDYSIATALQGHPAAPFYVGFQFFDTSGAPGNNSVTISNFNFGGGAAGAGPTLGLGASGNLTSSVSLFDIDPVAIGAGTRGFVQQFTPGNNLSFTVNFNGSVNPDLDAFTFQILENNNGGLFGGVPGVDLIPIASSEPGFSDALLLVNLDSTVVPTIGSFGHDPGLLVQPSIGPDFNMGPGTATLIAVPEPSSLTVVALGAVCFAIRRRNRKAGK